MFDVDLSTGVIGEGRTNAHWYQLGPAAVSGCPWLPPGTYSHHPDSPNPQVTGMVVPDLQEAVRIVTEYVFLLFLSSSPFSFNWGLLYP